MQVKYLIILIILLTVFSCKTLFEEISKDTNKSSEIRVILLLDAQDYKIKLNKDIAVENDSTGEKINFTKNIKELIIKKVDDSIYINDEKLNSPVKIYSTENRLITINDKKYLGALKIIPKDNEIKVINYVPTETYLMSVLLSEMPLSFDIEALKAQVVIARTYATLFKDKYSKKRDFDVDDTTNYQVYKGYNVYIDYQYIKKIEKAIKETKGEIVVYNDKPILAYFHANSGGKLTSGKDYFGEYSDFPYLVEKDDPYSLNTKGSTWEYKIKIDDFLLLFGYKYKQPEKDEDRLHDNSIDELVNILYFDAIEDQIYNILDSYFSDILDSSYSGLSNDSFKYFDDGIFKNMTLNEKIFYAKDIRKAIGNSIFKSIKFKINVDYDKNLITFNGIGYGHGVGMSQWGAQGMAMKGFKYKDIIDFYFPNTKVVKVPDENINF